MRRRDFGKLAGLAALGGLTAVRGWAADRMVVGTGVDPTLSQFYVGPEAGIFKKHGLDVEVKLFGSASASTPSLIPGDIQASLTSVPAGVLAHARAPKVVLVAMTDIATDYYGVIAESRLKTLGDLRGQKVGVAMGTSSEVFAIQALERASMTLKDVQVVNVEPPEMLAALIRKDVSAFFVWEPWLTRAKMATRGQSHILPGSDFYYIHNHLVMDREWIEKNRDTTLRFLRAVKEAGEFAMQRPAEAAPMIARFLKLDVELVKELLPKCKFMMVLDDVAMQFMKKEVDALIATKRITAPFDYKGYVYPDPLREIDPKAVSFTLPQ
jgi:ABC-type nitrate/sulfonate/bicarbonate transport system substrate-binding protein